MSEKGKRFLRQDYFRYKRLGMKWRRPKGRQSKQRKEKKGEARAKIGYKSPPVTKPRMITSMNDLSSVGKDDSIIISSSVGLKKFGQIVDAAKKKGINVLNKKRMKKFEQRKKLIEKKKKSKHGEKGGKE